MTLRNLTSAETNLVERLKEYWENHKYFFTISLDCCSFLDIIENQKFQSERYIGKIALKVATSVCQSDEIKWQKFLRKHGIYSDFSSFDTSEYIGIIFRAIQKVDLSPVQQADLHQAISIAKDPQYEDLVKMRLELIAEYSDARYQKTKLKLKL